MPRLNAKKLLWIGVGLLVGVMLLGFALTGLMQGPDNGTTFLITFKASSFLTSIMLLAQFVGTASLTAGLIIGAQEESDFMPKLKPRLLWIGAYLLLGAFAVDLIATSLMNYLTQGSRTQEIVIEIWPFASALMWLALFAGAAALTAGLVLGASPQDDAGTGLAGRQHLGSEPSRPESDPPTGD